MISFLRRTQSIISNNKHFVGSVGGGTIYIVGILFLLVAFGAVLTNGLVPPDKMPSGAAVTIVPPAPDTEKKNLQLYTFGYTTPAPKPTTPPKGQSCGPNDDNGIPQPPECKCDAFSDTIAINCKGDKAYHDDGTPLGIQYDHFCASHHPWTPHDGRYCIKKPVIYLYPQIPTFVDVQVQTAGKIFISDPLYPVDGWKNILAYPNGDLYYKNKHYTELFYESEVTDYKKPEKGIIIKSSELSQKLSSILDQLGLIGREKEEFLDFWIPELQALKSPYIFFSIFDKSEKERLDTVNITPTPDTFIAFIAYFKPLESIPLNLKPLELSEEPQERIGFTAVEWGGSLDISEK